MVIDKETNKTPYTIRPLVQMKNSDSNYQISDNREIYPKTPKRKSCFLSLSIVIVNLIMSLKCKHPKS